MKLYACMDKLKHKIAKLDEQIKLKGGKKNSGPNILLLY